MKAARLLVGLICGVVSLALFSGCETQQSACEREKRLTERMDELQMDIDGKMTGVSSEMASLRANPPVVVQQVPAPASMSVDQIAIEDYNSTKAAELQRLADISREQQLWAPAPSRPAASASSKGAIRVPVPARTIQAALKEAGFYHGNLDGKAGPQTVSAISAFQRSQGLKADGVVGRATWAALQAFVPAGMSTTRLK